MYHGGDCPSLSVLAHLWVSICYKIASIQNALIVALETINTVDEDV